jgi:hypothetical protein
MAIQMHCPHCRAWAIARSSNVLTSTSRDLFYQCSNVDCGHTFRAVLEVNCTISPSAMPDPRVVIPLSKHVRRTLLAEQMQRMPASDYMPDTRGQTGELFEQQ